MLYVVGSLGGVTQLDNMLYVVTSESIIRTLSVDTLSSLGDIHVQGMEYPSDIVVCRHDRQLYVADRYCIWRVSADDHSYVKWLPSESTDRFYVNSLSVTSRGLLVTSQHPLCSLREYSMTDRQLLRVFEPSWNMRQLYHGVETTRCTFVIGYKATSYYDRRYAVSCHHINTLVLLRFNYNYHFTLSCIVLVRERLAKRPLSPIHTADADETKLSSLVASAVCTRIRN